MKQWSKNEQLARFVLRHRACDCKEICGPIEAPLEIELVGLALAALLTHLVSCQRSSVWWYILFWAVWEAALFGGKFLRITPGQGPVCSTNINYIRRWFVIGFSIVVWLIGRELFCPAPTKTT
jgi:hypothetical protein